MSNTEITKEMQYRQLVEEFSDTVTRLCIVHTGNYTDAEDCYQNVFKEMQKKIQRSPVKIR